MTAIPFWKSKSFSEMSHQEWESLCDGCGLCCLHKLEDINTGQVRLTSVACRLLHLDTIRCRNYRERKKIIPDCIALSPKNVRSYQWLPDSCAYKLLDSGAPLPDWHYLVCGDRERVHQIGISVKGRVISEDETSDPEDHLWPEQP